MKIEVYSPTIRRKDMDAVLTVMVEEKIGPGERNRFLIQTAKEQIHFDYALALRSPAVALHFALKALSVKQGQAVVISALSPRYYLQVLQDLNLIPLYCDVTNDFPCMNKDLIEKTILNKPSDLEVGAIILHHTLGFVPDGNSLKELGLPVIEDISQSYGSFFSPPDNEKNKKDEKGNSQGSINQILPDSSILILGLEERDILTSGGGALLFAMNRKEASLLRNFTGIADEYCLADINSALACVQFKEIMRNLQRRRDIAEVYLKASLRTRHKRFIPINDLEYNNYSFALVLETGLKDVISYAKKKDIILENAFTNTIASTGIIDNCPVSNSLCLRTVLFPLYPRLRSAETERICRLIMTLP